MRDASESLQLEWQDQPEGAETAYRLFRLHQDRCRRVRADAPQVETPRPVPDGVATEIAISA